ncbi:MAG: chemotaxis protein CheW [Bacteroidales bacterium]
MANKKSNILDSYLSFKLGEEIFAANAGKVINILEMCPITEVPKSPEYMKGIINLRGTVLPVVDLRLKLGMSSIETSVTTCIIVLDITIENESVLVGAIVDAVKAVVEFNSEEMMPPPSIGSKYKSDFITGVVNKDDEFIMVLDMDAIFTSDEILEVKATTEGVNEQNIAEV